MEKETSVPNPLGKVSVENELKTPVVIDYVRIARLDHWFKNVFMLPGAALALYFLEVPFWKGIGPFLLGVFSTCLLASANYVINEWLDAEYDRHHPLKKKRPSALGRIERKYVYAEYLLLAVAGLATAAAVSSQFATFSVAFLLMGVVYNVAPLRSKDRVYLDVLSESVNNPLRLLLGWASVASVTASPFLPPSSIVLAYWMGGAFLMAVKRYAEYRFIDDPERAGLYRRSFRFYSSETLLLSAFFYGLCSAFLIAVFLIKYRIEFLLSTPLFALLFTWYLAIGLKPKSVTQRPEKLYRERAFVGYVLVLALLVGLLFVVDLPWLQIFVKRLEYL